MTLLLALFAALAVGLLVIGSVVATRLRRAREGTKGESEESWGWVKTYLTGWRMASELGLGWLMVLWTLDIALILIMLLGFCGYDLLTGTP